MKPCDNCVYRNGCSLKTRSAVWQKWCRKAWDETPWWPRFGMMETLGWTAAIIAVALIGYARP